jgi:type II secretory pathway predicted ATPase ExeA
LVCSHWKLAHHPFAGFQPVYVATPGHDEAVARLVDAVECGHRVAALHGGAGLGKSMVLAQALARLRQPRRRVVGARGPVDGASLFAELARQLGRACEGASRADAWRAVITAVRLHGLQGLELVIAVDDDQILEGAGAARDLARLAAIDHGSDARVTVVRVGRGSINAADCAVKLAPLSRSEGATYLETKIARAGRAEPAFSSRALTRIHAHAEGVPRRLDRLASLCLLEGAAQGLEIVPAEVVEAVAARSIQRVAS